MGEFIPRHMQIFKSNDFFSGLGIPDPGVVDPLEKKMPKDKVGLEGVDFMKVGVSWVRTSLNKIVFKFRGHSLLPVAEEPGEGPRQTLDLRGPDEAHLLQDARVQGAQVRGHFVVEPTGE